MDYAENLERLDPAELPVFVEVLHRQLPTGDSLDAEAMALTEAIARVAVRPIDRVHVRYAPAAAGRQAFGGQLVR